MILEGQAAILTQASGRAGVAKAWPGLGRERAALLKSKYYNRSGLTFILLSGAFTPFSRLLPRDFVMRDCVLILGGRWTVACSKLPRGLKSPFPGLRSSQSESLELERSQLRWCSWVDILKL